MPKPKKERGIRAELIEKFTKWKSDCKVYHNEIINTPDKIKMYNQTLDWVIEVLSTPTLAKGKKK
jgi:hypothetical protein